MKGPPLLSLTHQRLPGPPPSCSLGWTPPHYGFCSVPLPVTTCRRAAGWSAQLVTSNYISVLSHYNTKIPLFPYSSLLEIIVYSDFS